MMVFEFYGKKSATWDFKSNGLKYGNILRFIDRFKLGFVSLKVIGVDIFEFYEGNINLHMNIYSNMVV